MLPDYMIPSTFVRIDALPLTTSGKLDRKALPAPCAENALGQHRKAARRKPRPKSVSRKSLPASSNVPQIGIDDNFFMTGGHSLLGTQVVMRARDDFGVDLTLRHLFAAPTVAKLAAVIERPRLRESGGDERRRSRTESRELTRGPRKST